MDNNNYNSNTEKKSEESINSVTIDSNMATENRNEGNPAENNSYNLNQNQYINNNQGNNQGFNPYMHVNPNMQSNMQPNMQADTQQQPRPVMPLQQPAQAVQTPVEPKKKKSGGFGGTIGKTIAAALIFGIVASAVFTGVTYTANRALGISASSDATSNSKSDKNSDSNATKKATDFDQSGSVSQTATGKATDLTDVSGIVNSVMPSIVAITNTATVTYQSFWGMNQSYQAESAGSGIIINQDKDYLYIATNNHVVAGSEALKVQFADEKVVEAEVQGTDPSDDLAVVKVPLKNIESETLNTIKVATVGDSDNLSVGEASIAIGNALGYGQSVTTGVISALGRSVTSQDESTGVTITNNNLIQTDAAINPGNSGGALLNSKGEVIGINSVKYASTEVEGIGYAIAMNDAMPILQSLIENGDYVNTQEAYLGIQGGDVSSDMAAFNFPAGVYVSAVLPGSGAQKAGIQEGDIITKIEGKDISSMDQLKSIVGKYKAGEDVTITVARQQGQGYEESDITVTLSSRSEIEAQNGGKANDNNNKDNKNKPRR